ncbi:MAG TPA: hypothetical protein VL242_44545, partial [Sorangium sp.]|nr:hypothetical protein [Sorangium sp.]
MVAISDISPCEIEPGGGLWMRCRQAPCSPDGEVAAQLDAPLDEMKQVRARVAGRRELTMRLNRDVRMDRRDRPPRSCGDGGGRLRPESIDLGLAFIDAQTAQVEQVRRRRLGISRTAQARCGQVIGSAA